MMRKFLLFTCFVTLLQILAEAQCGGSYYYPNSPVTVDAGGALTTIATDQYSGDYSRVTGIVAGETYEFTITSGMYITIEDVPTITVQANGYSPLTYTATSNDDLYISWHDDASCGTLNTNETTTVQCTSCGGGGGGGGGGGSGGGQSGNQFLSFFGYGTNTTSKTLTSDTDPLEFSSWDGCIQGDISVTKSGGSYINSSPKYNGNGSTGVPAGQFGFYTGINWTTQSQNVVITIDFKKSGSLIELPIEFTISDINSAVCGALSSVRFIDKVSVVGYKSDLSTSVNPTTFTKLCASNNLSGYSTTGNSTCGGTTGIDVKFNTSNQIARLVITYESGINSDVSCGGGWLPSDPGSQFIALSAINLNYDCTTVLPIEMLSQKINCVNNTTEISWITSSESNNDFFTIWRSNNGFDFEEMTNIKGAGNSNTLLKYKWVDDSSSDDNILYYKISQTDYDGTSYFFPILSSKKCGSNNSLIAFFNDAEELIIKSNDIKDVMVYDSVGKLIYSSIHNQNNIFSKRIEISTGMYFITARKNNGEFLTKKLFKK